MIPLFGKGQTHHKKKWILHNFLLHHNDYIDSPFLSSQILLVLDLTHSHILVKLFYMIWWILSLPLGILLFFYHNSNITLAINHLKPKKIKITKDLLRFPLFLSLGRYYCNSKLNATKHSFITRIIIDISLFQSRLYQQQHSHCKIVAIILYKVIELNLCRILGNFQMVLLLELIW